MDASEGLPPIDEMLDDTAAPVVEPTATDKGRLSALADEMLEAKRALEDATAHKASLEKRWNELRRVEMPELMQELGLVGPDGKGRFTHESGAKVHLQVEIFAHVRAADRDAFFSYLRETGNGDLIRETVHHQTLTAFAKECLRDGRATPEMLKIETGKKAVLTKPKEQEL